MDGEKEKTPEPKGGQGGESTGPVTFNGPEQCEDWQCSPPDSRVGESGDRGGR